MLHLHIRRADYLPYKTPRKIWRDIGTIFREKAQTKNLTSTTFVIYYSLTSKRFN